MFGLWALSSAIVIPIGYYASEVFRAKGRPKLSFASQIAYLVVMTPVNYFAATLDFASFALVSSLIRLAAIIIDMVILKAFVRFPVGRMLRGLAPIFLCSLAMLGIGRLLGGLGVPDFAGIAACVIAYALCCEVFPTTRVELNGMLSKFTKKGKA